MDCVEFIKRFGWLRAKQVLKYANSGSTHFIADGLSCTYVNEPLEGYCSLAILDEFVDARRLVDLYGCLYSAKEYINHPSTKQDKNTMYLYDSINLVELCQ